MDNLRYTIIFQPEPEGGFTVTVPALPGCITYGKDFEEAKEMAADAIGAYVESLRKHKQAVPIDQETLVSSIEVRKRAKGKMQVYA